ncbi:MAG: hypothetical protein GY851_26735 [bacterium]|nr:hypothetical protein [bacterium]
MDREPQCILKFDVLAHREEMHDAINGWRYKAVIHDVLGAIRQQLKHGSSELTGALADERREIESFLAAEDPEATHISTELEPEQLVRVLSWSSAAYRRLIMAKMDDWGVQCE